MKKMLVAFLGATVLVAFVFIPRNPAVAGGQMDEPPDCGSHVACPGDPKPQPKSPVVIDDECARHIRCPDGGDGGVDPTPDDGCPIGQPCNYDAPGYTPPGAPDVPPPNDKPGRRVEVNSLDPKPKPKAKPMTDDSVEEAPPAKVVTGQPRTVG